MLAMHCSGALAGDSILIEFSSPNCPPCRAMHPIVSELIARGVPVRQIDVQAEPHQARRFSVRSTPTYIVLQDGREVTRLIGAQSIDKLRNALQQSATGPLVPTRSRVAEALSFNNPHTRLAPLSNARNQDAFLGEKNGSVRQQNAPNWRPLKSQAAIGSQSPRAAQSQASPPPVDVEAMPSSTLADAVERAQAATVRLRVFDGRGYGAGTGTIIDVHGEEALVLTCGHLFRDGEGDDKIEVDVFVGGEPRTVTGQLIDFDAGDRDIGLVAIRPGFAVQPIDVLPSGEKVKVGQIAFSFGCDRGDDPSRRDTRITGVDKYNQNIGASNLEISGAPIDGRSGGGLFDQRGRLIGVCNAADYKSDTGIYTGPRSVYWQLDRVKLARLYESKPGDVFASNDRQAVPAGNTNLGAVTPSFDTQDESSTEMIVILRGRNGQKQEQVLTLDRPDAALVQRIRAAARR